MRIAVAGALAQRPRRGGHAWVFLQYLLGFRRLGCDVVFVDRLEPGMSTDAFGRPCRPEDSTNLAYVRQVMREFGFEDSTAVLVDGGRRSLGLDRDSLRRVLKGTELLVDVMGYLQVEDMVEAAPLRLFLDIDPGFLQIWFEQGLHDPFGHHHAYATFGENIGRSGCSVPTCGVTWIRTRPPVVLDQWPVVPPSTDRITSVGSWRGPFAPLVHNGETYGLRVHQFRPLADLPSLTGRPLELALDIDAADTKDLDVLRRRGWTLVDPGQAAGTPGAYRDYLQGSAAELMVPKGMYVKSASGWFSDRSACYLASGRPVVAQDTGLEALYPVGEGLLCFQSVDEASKCVDALWGNYADHAQAARGLAEEYFASDGVLTRLLGDVGLG